MLRQFLRPWSLALGMLAFPGVAAALPNCEGTYAATPLQPLPAGVSVGWDIHDASPENQRLAQHGSAVVFRIRRGRRRGYRKLEYSHDIFGTTRWNRVAVV